MERGRQAGPGQAEDMREKKSTEDSTGHESSRAHTTVQLGNGMCGGMEEKARLEREVGKRLQKVFHVKLTILIRPSKDIKKQNKKQNLTHHLKRSEVRAIRKLMYCTSI